MDRKVLKKLLNYLIILVGGFIYAVGFQFFMYPNAIVSGGITGIAMILNTFTGFPVGMMVIVLNIPLFVISWRHFGLDFMLGSLAGVAISSVFVDLLATTGIVLTNESMLGAIIGGVIKGAGLGAIYYVGATTGGIDIVAKMLRQRYSQINFGTMILIMDSLIIIIYAAVLGNYESAMYSVIAMFVVSKVIDLVLYGFDTSSLCYIISENSEDLIQSIISGPIQRGVTILEGEGAYSHRQKQVIMCVIKRNQIAQLRRLVKSIDENAFFIVADVKNVFGKGFESISEIR
ncbi:MAG: YitT family protein [Oscillospiraceae bacterium]|nr:YitT family protein [Oscillospiraceae bacterium]